MFDRFYSWMMRNGSRALFLIALALFASTWILYVFGLNGSGPPAGFETAQSPASWVLSWATPFVASFHAAVLPFFGALLIDRLDRNHRSSK